MLDSMIARSADRIGTRSILPSLLMETPELVGGWLGGFDVGCDSAVRLSLQPETANKTMSIAELRMTER
jgi:hypothetical protein